MADATSIQGKSVASTPPGRGEVQVFDYDADQYKPGKAVPPGWYDPRHYGAQFDGVTDDLAAMQALHAALPTIGGIIQLPLGIAWLSDTWRVSKPIQIRGAYGGGDTSCGFEVAPGKTAIQLDSSPVSLDGNTAQHSYIKYVDFKSHIMVHGTAYGGTAGQGIINDYVSGGTVRKGDVFVALSNANPTRCYRAQSAGMFGTGGEPMWNTMLGETTTNE